MSNLLLFLFNMLYFTLSLQIPKYLNSRNVNSSITIGFTFFFQCKTAIEYWNIQDFNHG